MVTKNSGELNLLDLIDVEVDRGGFEPMTLQLSGGNTRSEG